MLVSFSLTAEELKAKKYYSIGEVTVSENCPAWPVIGMIQALIDGDVEKAKNFGTEDYNKYVKVVMSGGWDAVLKKYKNDWDRKEPISFRFYPDSKSEGENLVQIIFYKGDVTYRSKYRVKKIDGKFKIVGKR